MQSFFPSSPSNVGFPRVISSPSKGINSSDTFGNPKESFIFPSWIGDCGKLHLFPPWDALCGILQGLLSECPPQSCPLFQARDYPTERIVFRGRKVAYSFLKFVEAKIERNRGILKSNSLVQSSQSPNQGNTSLFESFSKRRERQSRFLNDPNFPVSMLCDQLNLMQRCCVGRIDQSRTFGVLDLGEMLKM